MNKYQKITLIAGAIIFILVMWYSPTVGRAFTRAIAVIMATALLYWGARNRLFFLVMVCIPVLLILICGIWLIVISAEEVDIDTERIRIVGSLLIVLSAGGLIVLGIMIGKYIKLGLPSREEEHVRKNSIGRVIHVLLRRRNIIIICLCLIILITSVFVWQKISNFGLKSMNNKLMTKSVNYINALPGVNGVDALPGVKGVNDLRGLNGTLDKINGDARLTGDGTFNGSIYNGSNWTITKLRFRVVAKEKNGSIRWDKEFIYSIRNRIRQILNDDADQIRDFEPSTTRDFSIDVTEDRNLGDFDWCIIEAWGKP